MAAHCVALSPSLTSGGLSREVEDYGFGLIGDDLGQVGARSRGVLVVAMAALFEGHHGGSLGVMSVATVGRSTIKTVTRTPLHIRGENLQSGHHWLDPVTTNLRHLLVESIVSMLMLWP